VLGLRWFANTCHSHPPATHDGILACNPDPCHFCHCRQGSLTTDEGSEQLQGLRCWLSQYRYTLSSGCDAFLLAGNTLLLQVLVGGMTDQQISMPSANLSAIATSWLKPYFTRLRLYHVHRFLHLVPHLATWHQKKGMQQGRWCSPQSIPCRLQPMDNYRSVLSLKSRGCVLDWKK
jgi:hypothetical protein